ncbi:MAG: hypothetical protein RLZZ211_1687 [Bacteroidota bacterium]|jgi:hypothetical protein
MSPEEALSIYKLNSEEPIEEQLELVFFELKQKIYRQLDQVLLYPKWLKELTRLSNASVILEHAFPITQLPTLLDSKPSNNTSALPMLAQFNWQQQLRSQVALQVYNGHSPALLIELLNLWQVKQEGFFAYWSGADLPAHDVLLSQQFDPQQLLSILNELDIAGILEPKDLREESTPLPLKKYISWNKAVWVKMKRT